MGSSGFKALLFVIPRLPGFFLMTFSSKSPNSWPAVKVRNPWIISVNLLACSSLSSAVQPDSSHPQTHAPGPQNMLAQGISSASLQHGNTHENTKANSSSKFLNPVACPVAVPARDPGAAQQRQLSVPSCHISARQVEPETGAAAC